MSNPKPSEKPYLPLYENDPFWICRTENGWFEVYQNGVTRAVRCASIGFMGDKGFQKAKQECDRRAAKFAEAQT